MRQGVPHFRGHLLLRRGSCADTRLLASLLRSVADLGRPALLIGDFNWKQQYESLMQHVGAEMFPVINTVVASNGSPTRALAFGSAANPSASARPPLASLTIRPFAMVVTHRPAGRSRPSATGAALLTLGIELASRAHS